MSAALYILTSVTMLLCAVLLLRAWSRVRRRLLLWSGLCFILLGASSLLKFVDLAIYRPDLYTWRLATVALAMGLLLYGLIWESQ
ncbi:MAG TPA: DUF5985 family protein [Terracidiphilus sp.]|nr:DUF5985 family protein [Terracidiphilus sp.]